MIANDISNDNYTNLRYSSALINMINGITPMIEIAPNSDKKDMLLDVLRFGKKVAEKVKVNANSVNYLLHDNSVLEIKLEAANINTLKLETKIKILEAHLKAALPMDEFKSKTDKLK